MENLQRTCALIGLALSCCCCCLGDDRELIARAASEWQTPPVSPGAANEPANADAQLAASERRARLAVSASTARLELIMARKALRGARNDDAAKHARAALAALAPLGDSEEFGELALQAEGILSRATRAPVTAGAMQPLSPVGAGSGQPPAAAGPKALPEPRDPARAAARIARGYDGADTPEIDTRGNADALHERAMLRAHEDSGYRPGREVVDLDAVYERDRQRLAYEGALREAYKADEARLLVEADQARIAPQGEIAFPDDWQERISKRAANRDGVAARSSTWTDKDGRQWHVAVYDIADLTYVPPDFAPIGGIDFVESLWNAEDRAALRWRSQIFGGYAEDLAAGIPLLRYFGGLDPYALRGPKYSAGRQQQVIDMINRFTNVGGTEPRVDGLRP